MLSISMGDARNRGLSSEAQWVLREESTKDEVVGFIIRKCDEVLALQPANTDALILKGKAFQVWGAAHRPEAISSYESALALLDERAPKTRGAAIQHILFALGQCYLGEHRPADAERLFGRLVAISPAIHNQCQMLTALVRQNRLDDAIAFWESIRDSRAAQPTSWRSPIDGEVIVNDTGPAVWHSKYEDLLAKKARGYVYRPRKAR